MRLRCALTASVLVLAVGAGAQAEPWDVGPSRVEPSRTVPTRIVRTSLDVPPVPAQPSPPRVITASLEPRSLERLGGEMVPRALRSSLDEEAAPAAVSAAAPPTLNDSSNSVTDAEAEAIPAGIEREAQSPVLAAQPPSPPEGSAEFGALECDCTRTHRSIRVSLDGVASVVSPGATPPRSIRVRL